MSLLSGLRGKRACVVGDLIVDHYRFLRASRLSPEAPIPIFRPVREERRLGGAANVAHNLRALGAGVVLASAVGTDFSQASRLLDVPFETELVPVHDRVSTVKERLIAKQQVARVDFQSDKDIPTDAAEELAFLAGRALASSDVLVLSDYDHGVMVPALVRPLVTEARRLGRPVVVDSKSRGPRKYDGCTIMLPNVKDTRAFLCSGAEDKDEDFLVSALLSLVDVEAVGLKVGPRGIVFKRRGDRRASRFPAFNATEDQVVDVTGAGDTVTAAVSAGLALGLDYDQVMRLANACAGLVVRRMGVATCSAEEAEEAMSSWKDPESA